MLGCRGFRRSAFLVVEVWRNRRYFWMGLVDTSVCGVKHVDVPLILRTVIYSSGNDKIMIQPLEKEKVFYYPHTSTERGQCSSFFKPSSLVARGTNRQKLPVGVISTTTRFGRYSCSLRDRFCNLSAPSSWRAVKGSKEAKYSCEAGSRSSRKGWASSSRPGFDPRNRGSGFEVGMEVRV